ncbi:hypothetical protein QQF64_012803 [Cirrhinus molitorella]|uniref:Uncharacterized protein n=1 Tax=Cirrhinus molitorella TaxID=172907 RepID=A0ABR3LWI3_9TELE
MFKHETMTKSSVHMKSQQGIMQEKLHNTKPSLHGQNDQVKDGETFRASVQRDGSDLQPSVMDRYLWLINSNERLDHLRTFE